jgi:hypothetical protein
MTVYTWIHSNIWFANMRSLLKGIVRTYLGVEPSEISMLFFLWFVRKSGSFEELTNFKDAKKFVHGAMSLSHFLSK